MKSFRYYRSTRAALRELEGDHKQLEADHRRLLREKATVETKYQTAVDALVEIRMAPGETTAYDLRNIAKIALHVVAHPQTPGEG